MAREAPAEAVPSAAVGEIVADTRLGPGEVPADAYLAVLWDDQAVPPTWRVLGVATGYKTLDEVLDGCGRQWPELDGRVVCATKIGGNSAMVRRLRRSLSTTVTVTLEQVK